MWYAILICTGIILATVLCCLRAPSHGLTSDQILNLVLVCVPAGIIGARLYYVLFHWDWYSSDLFSILNMRAGGLAIHGGLIAGLGTALLLCRHWRIRPLDLMDLAAPSIALAQSIGRWGNYFNSEAHGGPTDLPWAVIADGQPVHPTFLYESIWCFLLFLFLLLWDRRRCAQMPDASGRVFEGQIIFAYGFLYSLERFFVESLRTDSLMIGPFKQAQVISLVIIAVCLICYILLSRRAKRQAGR